MNVTEILEAIIRGELIVVLMGACICMGAWLGRGPR